jgi:hypothetical protein
MVAAAENTYAGDNIIIMHLRGDAVPIYLP